MLIRIVEGEELAYTFDLDPESIIHYSWDRAYLRHKDIEIMERKREHRPAYYLTNIKCPDFKIIKGKFQLGSVLINEVSNEERVTYVHIVREQDYDRFIKIEL